MDNNLSDTERRGNIIKLPNNISLKYLNLIDKLGEQDIVNLEKYIYNYKENVTLEKMKALLLLLNHNKVAESNIVNKIISFIEQPLFGWHDNKYILNNLNGIKTNTKKTK